MFGRKKKKKKKEEEAVAVETAEEDIGIPPEMKVSGWWKISFLDPTDPNKTERHIGYIPRAEDLVDWSMLEDKVRSDFVPEHGNGIYLLYACDIKKKVIPKLGAIQIVVDEDLEDESMVEEEKEATETPLSVLKKILEQRLVAEQDAAQIQMLIEALQNVKKTKDKDETEDDEGRLRRRHYPRYPEEGYPYSRFSESRAELNELRQSLNALKEQLLHGSRGNDSQQLYAVILQMQQSQMEARKQELELQRQRLEQERMRIEQDAKLKEQEMRERLEQEKQRLEQERMRLEQEAKLKEREMKERLEQEKQRIELEREKLKMEMERYEKELQAKEREHERKLKEERERMRLERELRDKETLEREKQMHSFQQSETQRWTTIIEALRDIKERRTEYPQEMLNAIAEQAKLVQQMSSTAIGSQLDLIKRVGSILERYGAIPPSAPEPVQPPEEKRTDLFEGLAKVINALSPFIEAQAQKPGAVSSSPSIPAQVQKAAKVLLPKPAKPTNRIKQLFGKDPEMLKALLVAMRKKDNPALYVGALGRFCGDLTPVVCNLPWNDIKTALSELVDDTGKKILATPETEEWWKQLTEETKKAIIAMSKQAEK